MNKFRTFYQSLLSASKRKDIIIVFMCLEAILAFSPFGYIDSDPISITTLYILIIVAAMLFGFKGGLPVTLVFVFSSIWKASVSSVQYQDIIFSPFRSGNPIGSLLLIIPRVLFALATAKMFDYYFKKEHKNPYIGISIIAIIGTTICNVLSVVFVNLLFNAISYLSKALIISQIILYILTIIIVCLSYKFYNSKKIQDGFKLISEYNSGKKYGIILGLSLLLLLTSVIVHFVDFLANNQETRMNGFTYIIHTQNGQLIQQFFLSLICALIIFMIVFSWISDFYFYSKVSIKENELKLKNELEVNQTLIKEHEKLVEKNKELEINNEIISGISSLYATIYRIDLISGEYEQIKGNAVIDAILKHKGYVNKNFDGSFKDMAHPDYQNCLMEFLNLETISDRLKDKNTVFIEYKSSNNKWREIRFIAKKRDANNNVTNVLLMINDIDSQKRIENEYHATIETLVEEYAAVYICDLVKDEITPFKISENSFSSIFMDDKVDCFKSYSSWNKYIWDNLVIKDSYPDYLEKTTSENLIEELKENNLFVLRADTIPNPSGLKNYECRYARINTGNNDEYKVIVAYRNIDDLVISEKKRNDELEKINNELVYQKKETELANNAKTNFLRRMSHDIRTPINGIIGTINIASRFPNDLAKQSECREKVKTSSNYLLALVNNILDMSKLESGEIKLENKSFCINEILNETSEIIKEYGSENCISLYTDFNDIKHRYLIGSKVHFQQVLMNIVSNAAKYNRYGGKIHLTCKEESDNGDIANFIFICKDTGLGMSKEYQKHIFEPFTQEANDARTSYKGSGLGMPIAKELIELQGGSIEFESELDKGSTFIIHIPFKIDKDVIIKEEINDSEIKDVKILVVEDNELNMEIAKFFLEDKGAIVKCANNGQEAIDMYKQDKYDVILMDIMMPIMDGLDASKIIRSYDKNIPIIAMSANAFSDDIEKSINAGMNEHVTKPLDVEKLANIINKLVKKA